jgi:hypothetical protein
MPVKEVNAEVKVRIEAKPFRLRVTAVDSQSAEPGDAMFRCRQVIQVNECHDSQRVNLIRCLLVAFSCGNLASRVGSTKNLLGSGELLAEYLHSF